MTNQLKTNVYSLPSSFSFSPNPWHLLTSGIRELNQNLQLLNDQSVLANNQHTREILHTMLGLAMMIESEPAEIAIKGLQHKIYSGEDLALTDLEALSKEVVNLINFLRNRPYYDILVLGSLNDSLEQSLESDDRIRKIGQVEYSFELETYIAEQLPDILMVTGVKDTDGKLIEKLNKVSTRYRGIRVIFDSTLFEHEDMYNHEFVEFSIKNLNIHSISDDIIFG